MTEQVQWGILGTGSIAGAFAQGLGQSRTGVLSSVGSRSKTTARAFADRYGAAVVHGSYEALLADPGVQAVYIATPHPMHAEWSIRAAEAGKQILCEKPVALNHADAMQIVEAARRNHVFLMEAFMYRCQPQTAQLVAKIRDGAIGELRMVRAEFGFHADRNLDGRLFANVLGGGGILDVGGYPVSMSRLLAGAGAGCPFLDPVEVIGTGRVPDDSRVDEWAAAILRFETGMVAQVACGISAQLENRVVAYGSDGHIEVAAPWIVQGRKPGTTTLVLHRHGKDPESFRIDADRGIYAVEADTVAAHLDQGQAPEMSWDDTLGNMRALDAWRRCLGVEYEAESPEAHRLPLGGRPLRRRPDAPEPTGSVAGLDRPVSRLVMGTDFLWTMPLASALFDDYFARGGNTFDTAYQYCRGQSERLLGHWISNRGIRDQVVIIAKGAHTPFCYPDALRSQFEESLERLQTDSVDLYFMHRDNPRVPVDEFIDALNDLRDAGRIRVFGASNWTQERVEAANAWAAENGRQGFGAVSNNFSLARMVNPPWKDCLASSTPDWRTWHATTQTPLFAWSSQARGFFVPGRAEPGQQADPMLAHAWYSQDNFERRARCFELANRKNVDPVNVALAYVLHQPFPVFAIIGPHTLRENESSFRGLNLSLTDAEYRWLNLETETSE